jgi:hypothetical protein
MASRIGCLTLALGVLLLPAVWERAQPRLSHADAAAATPASPAVSVDRELAAVQGIQAWVRVLSMSGPDDPARRAPTLFVPSDGAMRLLPDGMIDELLRPSGDALRRAFLARSATGTRLSAQDIAGQRIQLSTLDGRPLVIDATQGEVIVGDAEAIEIRELPDGRTLFILDDRISEGSAATD